MESVLLTNPAAIAGFILSFALCVFSFVVKPHKFISLVAAALFVATAAYALVKGADLYEVGIVATVFFLFNLIPLWKKGGDE